MVIGLKPLNADRQIINVMKTVKYLELLSDSERINLFERVYMQSKKMYYSLLSCWYTGNMDDGINDRINAKLLA